MHLLVVNPPLPHAAGGPRAPYCSHGGGFHPSGSTHPPEAPLPSPLAPKLGQTRRRLCRVTPRALGKAWLSHRRLSYRPLGCALLAISALTLAAPPAPARPPARPSVTDAPVQSVRTPSGTIGYRSVGHGPPLVLIMGLSGSIDAWDPGFIDALARHHRVVAFDNEGIGLTSLRPGTLTIARMGDDTAALISALHLRRPDVLGWSMGGFITQALAVRHPRLYRRLILSATAPGNGRAVLPSAAIIKVLSGGAGNILADLFPSDQARQGSAFVKAITRYPHFYLPSATVTALQLRASAQWLAGQDPSGRLIGRLRTSTLIADGAQDVILPSANSIKLGRLIRNSYVKLYPDAGHGFLFQVESSWVALIERFLAFGRPH